MKGDNNTANPILWDDIEARYWESTRNSRVMEDQQLEVSYRASCDKLNNTRLELQNLREELTKKIAKTDEEITGIGDSLRGLECKMHNDRVALTCSRVEEDEKKRKMFKQYRLVDDIPRVNNSDILRVDNGDIPRVNNGDGILESDNDTDSLYTNQGFDEQALPAEATPALVIEPGGSQLSESMMDNPEHGQLFLNTNITEPGQQMEIAELANLK